MQKFRKIVGRVFEKSGKNIIFSPFWPILAIFQRTSCKISEMTQNIKNPLG